MKEYILKNKKCLVNHVIALGILLVGFILGRYVFFDVHGMKEFPVVLLVLGLVVMVISVLTTKKILPYFISVGYIIGFVFGFIFQVTKMDANGVSVNNLWVIWAVVYVAFIVLGFICEWCFRKYGSSVDWKKNKSTKIVITILGIAVLWLCVGIVDFVLVHNYRKPLFCVGVDLADDGGSGRYVGLGYSFDIEGNFMPDVETPATEAEKPKVTSYRGYIFGIEVSRGFWDEMLPTPYKSMNDVIENAPSIQGNVTEVHETYMIIHIVTSGYPYGADCSVSLNPVYGDSYTDVSVGDEVVVYFNGDIMETDPLQLGTIYAITLRTPANRTEISESDIDKLIYGDIERTGEPDEYPALDIIPGADLDEPGELVESITVEYIGAGQIKKWSVSPELIDDVMEWYADLDYKKVTFKDGESPADGEGQTVYDIEFSDGTSFYYYDCGQEGYIRMDGTWYEVKNPKLPPVGEPV